MKRKTFEKHRDRCQAVFDEWIVKLGLAWYEVDVAYYDSRKQFRKDADRIVAARITTDWQYMRFAVDVCVPVVVDKTDAELERVIVHELCHALVNELREPDPIGKHEERVVTMLTKAFIWTRNLTRKENA
jgi:hypothetical protein